MKYELRNKVIQITQTEQQRENKLGEEMTAPGTWKMITKHSIFMSSEPQEERRKGTGLINSHRCQVKIPNLAEDIAY